METYKLGLERPDVRLGSYPTYEEWKQRLPINSIIDEMYGSYPTYEEWKRKNSVYIAYRYWFLSYL